MRVKQVGHSGTIERMPAPHDKTAKTNAGQGLEQVGQAEKGPDTAANPEADREIKRPREVDGPKGPEPTRYGDWERGGRCIDF